MKWFAKNYYIEKSWLGNIECKFDGYNNFGNRRAANKWRLLMITQEENLKSIIEEIKNNKIMLPDFQRQFDWNIEKQIGLVASVLTKLPVGGILLLEADSKDYKSKRIGLDSKEKIVGEIPQKTNFLLDGQQRMTCLTNVFSDVIHEASEKKVSRLAARQLLATRFYLKINRWDVNIVSESSKDLFGIRTLDFRFDVSNGEEPDFLTADITDYIECRPFLASEYDEKPYMPGQRYDDKLDDYCFATPGIYLIPLYLLVGSGSKDDKLRKKRLLAIIKRMRDQITESISTYHFNLDVEAKQEFAFSIIIDSLDRKKYSDASDKDEKFESLIIEKAELWEDYFQKYLYSCIEKMKLNKIEMPEGSRARAIDIYENMNMGGLSLSTLDLVAARVAKVSRESLYDRISKCLINNKKYNEAAFPKEIRRYIPLNYNASTKIKAVDTRASKSCSGLFLLNWERNEVPLNIGGYKYDKKTKTFPIFINYDKQDNISDTTKYEDHFVAENRLIAISKSGRSMDSEDVQNFLKATERGIDVQLFVRKNKDDKISKEFYYLGRVIATGNAKQFVIPNTDKTAVEIEWELETPVREDIYQYIVNE